MKKLSTMMALLVSLQENLKLNLRVMFQVKRVTLALASLDLPVALKCLTRMTSLVKARAL